MKKIGTNKLIKQVIMMVVLTFVLASSIFAWFSKQHRDYNIVFETGNLDVEATLYELPSGINGTKEEVVDPLMFNNVVSEDIFEFLLEIENKSTIRGQLTVTLFVSYSDIDFVDVFNLYIDEEPMTSFVLDDDQMIIYSDIFLKDELKDVYLKIEVNQLLTNAHYGEAFTIEKIEVRLEQIQN